MHIIDVIYRLAFHLTNIGGRVNMTGHILDYLLIPFLKACKGKYCYCWIYMIIGYI